jgi:hypothetical protein
VVAILWREEPHGAVREVEFHIEVAQEVLAEQDVLPIGE